MAPDLAAAMWLIESMRPISQIEDAGLIVFVNVILCICAAQLHFEFPSADTVTRRIVALYHSTEQLVTACLRLFSLFLQLASHLRDTVGVAFTCDGWTSVATKGYLDITVHWISPDFYMKNAVLRVVRLFEHTAEVRSLPFHCLTA